MILFSYEVDVLEIALHEAQDLVDKIVIVEASHSHRGVSHVIFTVINKDKTLSQHSKPLMWERLKWTERFSFVNRSLVQHVVADDLVSVDWALYQWQAERDQTLTGVTRVRALMSTWGWSQQEQEEVVFISGNVDEIMTRLASHNNPLYVS